jgi:hypothetical protein
VLVADAHHVETEDRLELDVMGLAFDVLEVVRRGLLCSETSATKPGEPMREDPAANESLKLTLDERYVWDSA